MSQYGIATWMPPCEFVTTTNDDPSPWVLWVDDCGEYWHFNYYATFKEAERAATVIRRKTLLAKSGRSRTLHDDSQTSWAWEEHEMMTGTVSVPDIRRIFITLEVRDWDMLNEARRD